jgi:hypothetical protein
MDVLKWMESLQTSESIGMEIKIVDLKEKKSFVYFVFSSTCKCF